MTLKTENYELFKKIVSNRDIIEPHVKTLMQSIKTRNMLEFRPILVNKKMGVVDGQHRLEAAKRLVIPVYYTICETAKIEDVMILNLTQRNWNAHDYVNYYAENGNENYDRLRSFCKRFDMEPQSAVRLIKGLSMSGGYIIKVIKMGEFVYPTDGNREKEVIQIIQNTRLAIDFMKKKCLGDKIFLTTVRLREAIEDFIARPDVEFEKFLNKISLKADALCKRTGYASYVDMLKAIYNYYNPEPIP
jgi:ParB-like nuclease domain